MSRILLFLALITYVSLPLHAAEEGDDRKAAPKGSDINVYDNARRAQQEEANAGKKSNAIGTMMMAAGAAMMATGMAMTPPNGGLIAAGAQMLMMGMQAKQTGSNMNKASGMSMNTGNLVGTDKGPTKIEGSDGSSLADRETANKDRETMRKLSDMGFEIDKNGNINGPNGMSFENKPVKTKADLVNNGLSESMASKVMAAANKAALAAEEKYGGEKGKTKKKDITDSELGGGDEGTSAGSLSVASSSGGGYGFPAGKGGKKSSKGGVSGKFRKVGGNDRIAVASDNIFEVVKRRYKLKNLQGDFIKEKF